MAIQRSFLALPRASFVYVDALVLVTVDLETVGQQVVEIAVVAVGCKDLVPILVVLPCENLWRIANRNQSKGLVQPRAETLPRDLDFEAFFGSLRGVGRFIFGALFPSKSGPTHKPSVELYVHASGSGAHGHGFDTRIRPRLRVLRSRDSSSSR
jgi:hypothetical protein